MPRTPNSSSSPATAERLLRVPLEQLHPHPLNANVMAPERRTTLRRNLEREDRYPPLVARPHPDRAGHWQLLDGHQRMLVLREMGHHEAQVFPWPCDDATALVLLATLNRLEGDDVPAKRAELLAALQESFALQELAALLPEDASAITESAALRDLDVDALLADLTAAAAGGDANSPRLLSFAVLPEDEAVIEAAVQVVADTLTGPHRRGRALAQICRAAGEVSDA